MSDPSKYTAEIVDVFKSMYESGVYMRRDSRGKPLELRGTEEAIDRAMDRIAELSGRMAKDVEVYNKEAAETYSNLRKTWGQAVYVNSREMEEFRRGMQAGDKMLINPRGRRGIASDAATRAAEAGFHSVSNNNVGILLEANRQLNATRNSIWQNASKLGATGHYEGTINSELWNRYERAERATWRRRKNK